MDDRIKIYTIMVCTKLEEDEDGWPEYGSSRVWGFYSDKETAIQALHENWTDMRETCYDYACIECYEEGICHPVISETQWFMFDSEKDGYFEIDCPEFDRKCCCRSMG